MVLKSKFLIKLGEVTARETMKRISDITKEIENITSKNPLNAKNANPENEDEYMKARNEAYKKGRPFPERKPNPHPLYRHVGSWNEEDLQKVMKSKEYQYDVYTQKKVQQYFELKYPGKQKLDATGRPY
ncbi:MAG: hypothetical protein ACI4OW_03460 [Alphaproteobacteria bacterium]